MKQPLHESPTLRLAKVDEEHLSAAIKTKVWGSKTPRFKTWRQGEFIAFIVGKQIAALAEVTGEPHYSETPIWNDSLYPFRLPIRFISVLSTTERVEMDGFIRDLLVSEWGRRYGRGILNQSPLRGSSAQVIIDQLQGNGLKSKGLENETNDC